MSKQIIISISREYGSGGHEIARHLAERFNLPMYDHNLLDEIAAGKQADAERLAKFDEAPKMKFLTRSVRGFSSSPEQNIAEMQFEFIREKAASGESFIIVGRCSETVLNDYECMIPIFVIGDYETKLERVMERRNMSAKEAAQAIQRHDRSRKAYHNHYCDIKWGDSRNYEVTINSSKLGIEGTVNYLAQYIEARAEMIPE